MRLKVYKIRTEDGEVRMFLHHSLIKFDAPTAVLTKEYIDGLQADLLDVVNSVCYDRSTYLYEAFVEGNGSYDIEYSQEPLQGTCVSLQKVYNLDKAAGRENLIEAYKAFAWEDWENLFNQAIHLGLMKASLPKE